MPLPTQAIERDRLRLSNILISRGWSVYLESERMAGGKEKENQSFQKKDPDLKYTDACYAISFRTYSTLNSLWNKFHVA